MNRKQALKTIAASAAGSFALPSLANAMNKTIPADLKGNINHSVCQWCYNDIPLEQAINDCVKDLQEGLNNLHCALVALITHDEISHEEYGEIYFLSREYVDISKEMVAIVKSFKPAGFKAPKLNEDTISQQQKMAN